MELNQKSVWLDWVPFGFERKVMKLIQPIVLGLFLLLGANAFGQISVTGSAIVKAKPDVAILNFRVMSHSENLKDGMNGSKFLVQNLFDRLKNHVKDDHVKTRSFNVRESSHYDDVKREYIRDGFIITHHITVRVEERMVPVVVNGHTKMVKTVLEEEVGKIIEAGIENIENVASRPIAPAPARSHTRINLPKNFDGAILFDGLIFDIKNKEALLLAARILAVKDAMKKAQVLAHTSGSLVGRVISIDERTQYKSTANVYRAKSSSRGGSMPIASGEKEIEVEVDMEFAILPNKGMPDLPPLQQK